MSDSIDCPNCNEEIEFEFEACDQGDGFSLVCKCDTTIDVGIDWEPSFYANSSCSRHDWEDFKVIGAEERCKLCKAHKSSEGDIHA